MTDSPTIADLEKFASTTPLELEAVEKLASFIKSLESVPHKRDSLLVRIECAVGKWVHGVMRSVLYFLSEKLEDLAHWVRYQA